MPLLPLLAAIVLSFPPGPRQRPTDQFVYHFTYAGSSFCPFPYTRNAGLLRIFRTFCLPQRPYRLFCFYILSLSWYINLPITLRDLVLSVDDRRPFPLYPPRYFIFYNLRIVFS